MGELLDRARAARDRMRVEPTPPGSAGGSSVDRARTARSQRQPVKDFYEVQGPPELVGGARGFGRQMLGTSELVMPSGERRIVPSVYDSPNAVDTGLDAARKAFPSPGRMMVKGARDLAQGLYELPGDVSEFFGGPSEFLGTPDLPPAMTQGPVEDMGAAVAQYAIPGAVGATAGAKALSAVTKGLPYIQRIAPWIGGLFGAAAGDVVATAPSEDPRTLGDLVGVGPTQTDPEDTGMERRLKVGAETLPLGTVTDAMTGVARGANRFARGLIEPYTPGTVGGRVAQAPTPRQQRFADRLSELRPESSNVASGRQRILAADVQDMVGGPQAAQDIAERIAPTVDQFREAGITPPTTAVLSEDPALLAMHSRLAADDPTYASALKQPSREIGERIKGAVGAEGDPYAVGRSLDAEVARTERTIPDVPETASASPTEASQRLDRFLESEVSGAEQARRELYNAIDPEGTLQVDLGHLKRAIDDAIAPRSALDLGGDEVRNYAGPVVDRILEAYAEGKPVRYKDLIDARPQLTQAINRARKDASPHTGRLVDIRNALDDYTRQLAGFPSGPGLEAFPGGIPPDAGLRAQEAERFFREDFAPRFREGEGNRLARDIQRGSQRSTSDTARRFTGPGVGQAERSAQLADIVTRSANPAEGRSAVRDYLVEELRRSAVRDGKIDPKSMRNFMSRRGDVWTSFPEVKREFDDLLSRAQAGETRLDELLQSPIGRFADEADPAQAINKIMGGRRPAADIREAIRTARQLGPDAEAGLRNSASNWIENRITTPTPEADGTSIVSAQRLRDFWNDAEAQRALNQLYGKETMDELKKWHNLIRKTITSGTGRAKVDPQSVINSSRVRSMLAASYGVVRGQQIATILNTSFDAVGKRVTTLNPEQARVLLFQQFMTDPDLAQRLLTADTKGVTQRLRAHTLPNIITAAAGDRETE